MVLFSANSFGQKLLTDSLEQKKIRLEGTPDFQETDTTYIKVLYEIARSYIYQIPDSTRSISARVVALSQTADFEKGLAGGKLGLGFYEIFRGNFDQGFEYSDQAKLHAKNTQADTLLLKSINGQAMGQFMQGDYPSAYLNCKEGLRNAEAFQNLEMQVYFNMNLATSFAILRDYKQALPYYESALRLTEESKDEAQRAQIESNLAYMYLHTNELERAKEYARKSIEVLHREKYQAWESFAWNTLGEVAIKEGDYQEALALFKNSEEILMPLEDLQRKAENLQGMAEAYFRLGDFDKSVDLAKEAENISQSIKYHIGIVKASELLFKNYVEFDKPQMALSYLGEAKKLSDSILESENRTKFLMLETQSRFDSEQRLIEYQNEKKLARQKTITYIAIIMLLSLVIIAFLIRKSALNQKKANKSLRELNATKDQLFSIIGHDLKAPIGTLQELLELYTSKEISEKEIAQMAPRLKQNVDHSSFTLNNLLFWAKSQMKGIHANPRPTLVANSIGSVLTQFETRIEEKKIRIDIMVDKDETLLIDPNHLEIILKNLLSNAVKFTPASGRVSIKTNTNEEFNELVICDEGIGMNREIVQAVLHREPITSQPGTQNEKGTGIGLQIVQDLVQANKGELKIESKPKSGSCFYIRLFKS